MIRQTTISLLSPYTSLFRSIRKSTRLIFFFFLNDPAPPEFYPFPLHAALPFSALIVDGALEPMELAHLPYKKGRTYEDYVGLAGLKRFGKKKWRRHVADVVEQLKTALQAEIGRAHV